MYPAKNGDSFLISMGTEHKKHILIDCGYIDTYKKFIKSDLQHIASRGESLDLLIVTHIDGDHISGAIKLLSENNSENFIKINEIWFNALEHLNFEKNEGMELEDSEKNILIQEIALGENYLKKINEEGISNEEISSKQGLTLRNLIKSGEYNWNSMFHRKAISIENRKSLNIGEITITILSPNEAKLQNLSNQWKKELKKKKLDFQFNENSYIDDAFELMQLTLDDKKTISSTPISLTSKRKTLEDLFNQVSPIDTSVTNGSSIAILLEAYDKKLLFLADAHPELLETELEKLRYDYFDLIKVPHHGSLQNMTDSLANILRSDKYLYSTNGKKHNHPDLAGIAKVILLQRQIKKRMFFNYETEASKFLLDDELQETYNYDVILGKENEILEIKL